MHIEGGPAPDTDVVPNSPVAESVPVKKKRLLSVGEKHKSIIGLVVFELRDEGVDIVGQSDVALSSVKRTDVPALKKMTPKRKLVSKEKVQPTRASPRFLAGKGLAGAVGSSVSEPAVVGELEIARKTVTETKKSLKLGVQPSRSSPRFMGKQSTVVDANTSSVDVVVSVSNASAAP